MLQLPPCAHTTSAQIITELSACVLSLRGRRRCELPGGSVCLRDFWALHGSSPSRGLLCRGQAHQDREQDRQPERKPSVMERLTPAAAHANGNGMPPGFEEPAARPTAKCANTLLWTRVSRTPL